MFRVRLYAHVSYSFITKIFIEPLYTLNFQQINIIPLIEICQCISKPNITLQI